MMTMKHLRYPIDPPLTYKSQEEEYEGIETPPLSLKKEATKKT